MDQHEKKRSKHSRTSGVRKHRTETGRREQGAGGVWGWVARVGDPVCRRGLRRRSEERRGGRRETIEERVERGLQYGSVIDCSLVDSL